jgi:ferredoxin
LINSELFDLNDDGIGVVLDPEPTGAAAADAERAILNCPEQAITWAGRSELTQHA